MSALRPTPAALAIGAPELCGLNAKRPVRRGSRVEIFFRARVQRGRVSRFFRRAIFSDRVVRKPRRRLPWLSSAPVPMPWARAVVEIIALPCRTMLRQFDPAPKSPSVPCRRSSGDFLVARALIAGPSDR
jgi:hypothetical protein